LGGEFSSHAKREEALTAAALRSTTARENKMKPRLKAAHGKLNQENRKQEKEAE